MKILCISDTHGFHEQLVIPKDVEMIIHAGDISNVKNPGLNANECITFLEWYDKLSTDICKILVAGNHDTSIEAKLVDPKTYSGIIYLNHESILLTEPYVSKSIKLFGSPYTPSFCNWAFNVPRHRLAPYWEDISIDTDIVITHGPPKGILDLSANRDGVLEQCGDKSLFNKVEEIKPKFHIFGHIHNMSGITNFGTRKIKDTVFINASGVKDGDFESGLINQGVVIEF